MIDIYLRAATEEIMKSDLPWAINDEGECISATHEWALDPIGNLIKTPAILDENFNIVADAIFYDGYHVNIRLIDELIADKIPESIKISVTTPKRVWA